MPARAEADVTPALPEASDVAPGRIYLVGGGLFALLVIIPVALWLLYGQASSGPAIGLARPDPPAQLAAFNAHEAAEMSALGWTDRSRGIAHIPVTEAMQLIVQRGKLPEWPTALPANQRCTFLAGAVPRSPAAINCAMGWSQWLGNAP